MFISDILLNEGKEKEAMKILKDLFDAHGKESKEVQSKYLNLLAEINPDEAIKV